MKKPRFLYIVAFCMLFSSCKAEPESNITLQEIISINASLETHPVLVGKSDVDVLTFKITTNSSENAKTLQRVTLIFASNEGLTNVAKSQLFFSGMDQGSLRHDLLASIDKLISPTVFTAEKKLGYGINVFKIAITPLATAKLSEAIYVTSIELNFSDGKTEVVNFSGKGAVIRFGHLLRTSDEDNCNTYRIPGLVTTNKGSLIAVYDNRYNNSSDLQGNIDIGMSRSIDGGQTWSSMKVIMDMKEWGSKPQEENGIGDPCVLVDRTTNTIWVAALWVNGIPGKSAWASSKPGLKPGETGQFMLVKSEDDGVTWSVPINITEQVKNPDWFLFFQGPGRGITMSDGTLVFPSQYKDDNQVPHSTLIYSKDNGKSWVSGTSAKSNTTEAQVVELEDGSLMLNMRDDRNRAEKGVNNGRAVAITKDLGVTWFTHPSSNSALPEPNCMASLISQNLNIGGKLKQVLFFSNPNNKNLRSNMTIKASIDGGLTWPTEYQVEINSEEGYGYSCLTMVDDQTLGILYEGVKCLYFQKIPVKQILKDIHR